MNADGRAELKDEPGMQAKLNNEADATFAFELFDVDGDGYVLEEEVHARFKQIYRCAATPGRFVRRNAVPLLCVLEL